MTDEQASGDCPSWVKGVTKVALVWQYTRSHRPKWDAPMPMAGPFTIATNGFGNSIKESTNGIMISDKDPNCFR